jgi:hypothetical protein
MPRKPKPPPIGHLVIEGLSDGREVREKSYVDDFDGQVRPIVQDVKPVRNLPTGAELRAGLQRAKREKAERERKQAQRMADSLVKTMRDMIDPPPHKPFKRRI